MHKKMLRSALAAAFSAVVAFGVLSGLSETKGDARADSTWRQPTVSVAFKDSTWVVAAADVPLDSTWGKEDSTWAVES